MFEATADVSEVSAEEIITRDAKLYQSAAEVDLHRPDRGGGLVPARAQGRAAGGDAAERERQDLHVYALMVTDVLEQGNPAARGRRRRRRGPGLRQEAQDSTIELPGVMSRKKQVAPKLLAAL